MEVKREIMRQSPSGNKGFIKLKCKMIRFDELGKHPVSELKRDSMVNRRRGLPEDTITDNLIIKGENLEVMRLLLDEFRERIKLVYMDPPYNTKWELYQYEDNLGDEWLPFMRERLEVARKLLSENGCIFVSINHVESHYLKVLMDEIFGRENFVHEIIWRYGRIVSRDAMLSGRMVRNHQTIYLYAKDIDAVQLNKVFLKNDEFKPLLLKNHRVVNLFRRYGLTDDQIDEILHAINHDLREECYPLEDLWNCNEWDELNSLKVDAYFGRVGEIMMVNGRPFVGQKPEKLMKRILELATREGDVVLDPFLGTGTMAAVAHKMRRQYIGIERMDYVDVVIRRLNRVVQGDHAGISRDVNWCGGGSFVYVNLEKFKEGES